MKALAVIAAAGSGLRMQSTSRKQYIMLAGKPILVRSAELFLYDSNFSEVVVVVPPGDRERAEELFLASNHGVGGVLKFVDGGATRQDSVFMGLQSLAGPGDFVFIHDAARPLATPELIGRLLEAAEKYGGAVPVIPVHDTVKKIDEDDFITVTPDRAGLRLVQTPQVFRRDLIMKAYLAGRDSGFTATDDASLFEKLGFPVKTIPGDRENLKITTSLDLLLAEQILKGRGC